MATKLKKIKDEEILNNYLNYVALDFPKNETQSANSINKYINSGVALMYLYEESTNLNVVINPEGTPQINQFVGERSSRLNGCGSFCKKIARHKSVLRRGWAFLTIDKTRKLAYLQYLAIFKEFRNMGYGSKFLSALKTKLKNYNALFLDCEAILNNNPIQTKRQQFYINNGFIKSELETLCWGINYNYFYYPLKASSIKGEDLFNSLFETYLIKHNKEHLTANFKRIK